MNASPRNNLLQVLAVMLLFAGSVGFIDIRFLQGSYSVEWPVLLFIFDNVIKKYSIGISHNR